MNKKSAYAFGLIVLPIALTWLGALAVTRATSPQEDPHAHCHMAPPEPAWKKTIARYELPDVILQRADGAGVRLRREIDDGRPVLLSFVFTSCTTICPVLSRTFAGIQSRLGADRDRVHMVSVSIDPEHDTPARLLEYAERYGAGPQWSFYTGSAEASVATQRAFDVYRGDKMNHVPATFLRAAPGKPWVRLEGFPSADEVVAEYRRLVAAD